MSIVSIGFSRVDKLQLSVHLLFALSFKCKEKIKLNPEELSFGPNNNELPYLSRFDKH